MPNESDHAFDQFIAGHSAGTTLRAIVVDVRPFGAFCELAAGVQGLLLVTDFEGGPRPMTFPGDYPRVGDTLDVTIAAVSPDARKIALTQRSLGDAVHPPCLRTPVEPMTMERDCS